MSRSLHLSESEWRESCFAAFDLMRDDPDEGRAIAKQMHQQAIAHRLPVLGTLLSCYWHLRTSSEVILPWPNLSLNELLQCSN